MTDKPLTGRTVFLIATFFFGVIIAVNLFMASQAIGTFPGIETRNTYMVSQEFDDRRDAQLALGWQPALSYADGTVRLEITGPDGQPVEAAEITGTLGRATSTRDDMTPDFVFDGSAYVAPAVLEPGNWNLRLVAKAQDGTPFRQRIVLWVRDGS